MQATPTASMRPQRNAAENKRAMLTWDREVEALQ